MKHAANIRTKVIEGLALLCVCTALTLGGTGLRPAQAVPAGYTLAWSDEFNGPVGSSPNSANWNFETGTGTQGWSNWELETYVSDTNHVSIVSDAAATDGSALKITATDDNGGIGTAGTYSSGRIDTYGKQTALFGYIEARAKNPIGTGLWPAFWLLGTDETTSGWPQCGEQDIMELFAGNDGVNMGSWHMNYAGNPITWTATYTLAGGATFNQAYHTFGDLWTQTAVTAYVDGVQYETHSASNSPGWIFNHPFFYIINLAVGGDAGAGTPTGPSEFPQSLYIDYVRYYTAPAGTSPGTSPATDPANDFTYTYNTSGNWTVDTSNVSYFNGDTSRFCRTYNGTEYINYKYPNSSAVSATIYTYQPDNPGTTAVTVWYSTNGGASYTQAASTSSAWTATTSSWGYYTLNNSGALPAGVTDVELQLAPTVAAWDTEIGSVTVTYGSAAPAAPTRLTALGGNATTSLSWTASSGATSYNVYRGATSGGEGSTPWATGITSTTYTDSGLTNGTTYFYTVKALNSGGTSGASNEASALPQVPAPAAPSGLTASAGNAQVSLTWTASSGATSYNVYRGTTSGGEAAAAIAAGVASTAYTNTGITNGTTYYYKVSAVNAGGTSGMSNEASATPQVPAPSAPTGLTATGKSADVTLSWTASSGATSYNIYRGTTAGGEAATAIVTGVTTTTYDNSGLTNGTTYYYKVSAVNAGGTSGLSNEASATPTAGEAPYGGTAAAVPGTVQAENYDTGGQGVAYNIPTVNGSANSYRTDGVDLEACTDTGGGYNVGWTTAGQWMKYTVNVATAGTYTVSFRLAAPTAITDGLHLANSVGTNLSGNVNVPATGGWQTWTTVTASVTLPAGQQALTVAQDTAGWNINFMSFAGMSAPTAPTGLTATAGNAQVALSWTASSGATSYSVYRGTAGGGESATAIATGVTATTYTNTGLTNGTAYFYKVAAVNAGGTSAQSTEASATPSAPSYSGTWQLTPESNTALRLDVAGNGTANGTLLNVTTSNGTTAQSFVFSSTGVVPTGDYNFVKSGGAYCVQSAGTTSGSNVEIWSCSGTAAQSWAVTADTTPAGYFQVANAGASGLCLNATGTTSGAAVTIATCNGGTGQQWSGL